jgi:hypothetical protein
MISFYQFVIKVIFSIFMILHLSEQLIKYLFNFEKTKDIEFIELNLFQRFNNFMLSILV